MLTSYEFDAVWGEYADILRRMHEDIRAARLQRAMVVWRELRWLVSQPAVTPAPGGLRQQPIRRATEPP